MSKTLADDLRALAITAATLGRVLHKPMHKNAPKNPAKGAAHFRASISNETVAEMRRMREADGATYRVIAECFGCSYWTARDIVTYRTRVDA